MIRNVSNPIAVTMDGTGLDIPYGAVAVRLYFEGSMTSDTLAIAESFGSDGTALTYNIEYDIYGHDNSAAFTGGVRLEYTVSGLNSNSQLHVTHGTPGAKTCFAIFTS